MTCFVLIPGSGGTAWYWSRVAPLLVAAGHEARPVDLPGDDEMAGIRERLAEFLTFDTEVLGISCDPVFALRAFADADGLNFPLLSDFWPHGEVSRAYGVLDERTGAPRRSSYVVDKQGLVSWAVHNASSEARDLEEHLRQLRAVS